MRARQVKAHFIWAEIEANCIQSKSNIFLLASPRFSDLPMALDRLKERSMARNESEASKSPFHVCDAKRLVVWLAYLWPLPPPKTSLVKKIVFCYQNCSDLLWEKNVLGILRKTFKIRGWSPRICKIFEGKVRTFLVTECFFNLFLEVSHTYYKSEQLEFKLEKIIGILKHAGTVRKRTLIQRLL